MQEMMPYNETTLIKMIGKAKDYAFITCINKYDWFGWIQNLQL